MDMIQSLESRRYMSTITLTNGYYNDVFVVGRRNRSDEIVVTNDPKRASKILVLVNGIGQKYARVPYLRLDIYGRGGDDHVVIDHFASWVSVVSGDGGNDVLEIRDQSPPATRGGYPFFPPFPSAPALLGGDGNDRLVGGPFISGSLDGGDGNDTLIAGAMGDQMDGGAGDDSLVGGGGAQPSYREELYGGTGNDTLKAGANGDYLYGGHGNDSLISGAAGDALSGGNGNDVLVGRSAGSSVFDGGRGNDTITGTDGADTIAAGEGLDVVNGRGGNDLINGDLGWQVSEWDLVGPVNDVLFGGPGDDTIYGNSGNDQVNGDAGDDHLYGDQGDDSLMGGAGNDTLGGDAEGITDFEYPTWTPGNDRLDGGADDDWLVGHGWNASGESPEKDTMTGGLGNDVIDAREGTGDAITDRGAGDFVPEDVQDIWNNLDGKQVTLSVSVPLFYNPAGLPFLYETSPELSFYTSSDNQVTIVDSPQHPFVVKDLFRIWAVPIDSSNVGRYQISGATVNGVSVADIANYQPRDGDVIVVATT
ncbi:MAG: Hemolysin-type calcium-binding region [Phycisphaerales bacterium]|nr:Hemolysin-type calcium-binding region [Phycisphaerales bacterium]